MAVIFNLKRCPNLNCIRIIGSNLFSHTTEHKITLDTALDEFTSQLIQRKTEKWGAQNVPSQHANAKIIVYKDSQNVIKCNVKNLSATQINLLFQEYIDVGDQKNVLELFNGCVQHRKCPSFSILTYILTISAQNGNKVAIKDAENLCAECQPEILESNSHFRHYLAEAIWIKGNITESLKLFKEIYKENVFLRRRIRLIFKYLILDVNIVMKQSEAALVNIIQFGGDILNEYKDFFFMVCVWQACFLSEWFTDQQLALELLERNNGLCKAVCSRIPYVVAISLRSHRTEVVYRLLEVLLKYEMKAQYSGVLLALLNYQIRQGDIRSCSEIMQWSLQYNIQLPQFHHGRFLKLLLAFSGDAQNKSQAVKEKGKDVNMNFKF